MVSPKILLNGQEVSAHIYEYTAQVSIDADLRFLDQNLCVLIDVGTKTKFYLDLSFLEDI